MRYAIFAALGLAGAATAAGAAEVVLTELDYDGDRYRYRYEGIVDVPSDTVRALVSDPDRLRELNESIVSARLRERLSPTHYIRELEVKHCVMFWCFDINMVEHVRTLDATTIDTEIIPADSDFAGGWSQWTLTDLAGETTRIDLVGERQPTFWIPMIIGRWIMAAEFRKGMKHTTEQLEVVGKQMLEAAPATQEADTPPRAAARGGAGAIPLAD